MSYEAVLGSTKFQPVSCSDPLCTQGVWADTRMKFCAAQNALLFHVGSHMCVIYSRKIKSGNELFWNSLFPLSSPSAHSEMCWPSFFFGGGADLMSFLWVRLQLTQRWVACATFTQSFGQGPKGLGQRFRGLRALQFDHHHPTINKKNPGGRGVPLSSYTLISFHSFLHFYQTILPNVYK